MAVGTRSATFFLGWCNSHVQTCPTVRLLLVLEKIYVTPQTFSVQEVLLK
jgi:hypothetical protein